MSEFLKLAYELLGTMLINLIGFFATIGKAFVKLFIVDIPQYIKIFFAYTSDFGILQWILSILLVAAILALLAFLVWRLFLAVKHQLAKRKEKFNEEDMLREIGFLNRQVVDLIDEKNKIMAMRVSQLGLTPGDSEELYASKMDKEKEGAEENQEVRFAKLALVDEKYAEYEEPVFDDRITLEGFTTGYRNFAASRMKLYYKPEVVRFFVAGMASSKILILEGTSGTGKTSLPYSFSRYLKNNAAIISVQPSYRDRTELLGYFNEFTKRFNETEFLKSLYEASYRKEPSFIVLDEMNLARIEYYFAEMLSVLEMPSAEEWKVDLVPTAWANDPKLMVDGKLNVSTTTWFVGTANNDDSTFTITDKVYDRAIPIEINNRAEAFEVEDTPPISITAEHLQQLFKKAIDENPITPTMRAKLDKLDGYITTRFKISFGNRIEKQMQSFVPVFVACGGTEGEALDYIIARKILKKFESLNIGYVRDEIKDLILFIEKTFGKTGLPESKKYLTKLQKMF
ncbi:MAG: hypothetical protein RR361_00985 [Anaerovorax sp.]